MREVVEDDVSLARLYLAFRSPAFGTDEYYAASICGAILGMRKGSRLQRVLVREREIAADATAFTFDLPKGSDILVVDVTARPGISTDQLESEVAQQIDLLRDKGVTQQEVDRAVSLIQADLIAAMQQASERADQLSKFATYFGNPSLINVQAERYRSVTADDVSRFARDRLVEGNRATLLYVPRPENGADPDADSETSTETSTDSQAGTAASAVMA